MGVVLGFWGFCGGIIIDAWAQHHGRRVKHTSRFSPGFIAK